MDKTLGEFLEELRGKLSLREASKKSGLSHTYIRDLELGINRKTNAPIIPSPETLKRLSTAYNHPYSNLLKMAGFTDDKSNDEMNNITELVLEKIANLKISIDEALKELQSKDFNETTLSEMLIRSLEARDVLNDESKELLLHPYQNKDKILGTFGGNILATIFGVLTTIEFKENTKEEIPTIRNVLKNTKLKWGKEKELKNDDREKVIEILELYQILDSDDRERAIEMMKVFTRMKKDT